MKILHIFMVKGYWYYDHSPAWLKALIMRSTHISFRLIYWAGQFNKNARIPLEIYWIDPEKIEYVSQRTEDADIFSKYYHHGRVSVGDWDLQRTTLAENRMYHYARDVFIDGQSGTSTQLYRDILSGKCDKYIRNESHLIKRLDAWEMLFEKIKTHGIQLQDELPNGNILDEICISIDRTGNPILEDGRHRFIIARCLGLKSIPVIVNRVHAEYWKQKKGQVYL